MSYRKHEATLEASLERAAEGCKRAAAGLGWRLAHESPRQLYFLEPHFSFQGGRLRLRRLWWWTTRLEMTVRLEPEGTGTHALFEGERVDLFVGRQVERDLVAFLDRVFSALGQKDESKKLARTMT